MRGIVASLLGRPYTGIELRPEQVAADVEQAAAICAPGVTTGSDAGELPDCTPELTPVERRSGGAWLKRDDVFAIAGVPGGKARTCWALAQGAAGLVTAGSRSSPQVNIVAHIARRLGVPCRVHTPHGALSPEVRAAQAAGAEVVQHRPGHNTVVIARARADARARGWTEIPFGMACPTAVEQTRRQVDNLPAGVERLVVPVGSAMSLAGILHGLRDAGRELPVLGVVVGADPAKRLEQYAPRGWRTQVTLVPAGVDYHAAVEADVDGVRLDPHYEAKCVRHLRPGDCLWVVGIRQTARQQPTAAAAPALPRWVVGDSREAAQLAPGAYDFVFSCPPYADLEVYSDDPRDLSTLPYGEFLAAYRQIIAGACRLLRTDRFAAFVVGDVRDERGLYRNFVGATVAAFEAAGLRLYNEAVLVTPLGSVPIRAGAHFGTGRKLGKTHQNVLVFVKGDPKRAAAACGPVEVVSLEALQAEAAAVVAA